MAEPNEAANSGKTVAPQSTSDLPDVAAPPLSPAETLGEPVLDAQMKAQVTAPPPQPAIGAASAAPRVAMPHIKMPPLTIPVMKVPPMPKLGVSRRLRHRAALAAVVMLAAGLGAAVGTVANRAPPSPPPPKPDTALIEENHALQRSVAKLTKDLGTLKASFETAARESRTQIARVNDKLAERAADVTGSISKPATVAAAPSPAPVIDRPETVSTPIPTPRPAIVQGWTVREARNGRIFVESRGEYFQIAPGVPLPGLGRVESIRREGDSWVVVTQKGLITSGQSSAAIRQRVYPPFYRPY